MYQRPIRLVTTLYGGSQSRVRIAGGVSDEFEILVGVHQGSVLSPLLSILIKEEATGNEMVEDLGSCFTRMTLSSQLSPELRWNVSL